MEEFRIPGFKAAGGAVGIKKDGKDDLALVVSETRCTAAAVFTQNAFAAAPVLYDRALMDRAATHIQAVIINAGNANACTGTPGLRRAEAMARLTEQTLGLPPDHAFVMSTGVIGVPLPVERIEQGLPQVAARLREDGWLEAARAIMTTDTFPKLAHVALSGDLAPAVVGGMAKGAGMIHPNMATMLAVLATDLPVSAEVLHTVLKRAVDASFNRISVDGDTSTNDTVLLLANGRASVPPLERLDDPRLPQFQEAVTRVARSLAHMIVRDGEGATKFVTIRVRGAVDDADALRAARAVANSPLCKTAFFGGDPNWGRVLAAVGYSGARVDPNRTSLWFAGGTDGKRGPALQVVQGGVPTDYEESEAAHIFAQPEIDVLIDLGLGPGEAEMWTCDLGYEYVRINAEYRT
ncbi:MAG: bifunctional glutamate N-acetyltransferase/amino-acid acetyltransferase ArgJ [Chloroflexi bacterium]|nr:bifunctional glutamate N-acetyltransferase/amino-acid acetyltransferase ArgJ [Chloroflexota bacterium]